MFVLALVQPLALPSPALHSLKADATPTLGHNDVAIAFCYEDAVISANECGERYQSTCTGSSGLGECCSAAGMCGSDEASCGEGVQSEFSHGKNLCEEGKARDGFDQQAAVASGLQAAQPDAQQAAPVFDALKNADDLKALMDAACDFDALGCNAKTTICSTCYIHFESCKNGCAITNCCLGTQRIHSTNRELRGHWPVPSPST